MEKNYFFNSFPKEDEFIVASLWEDYQLMLDIDFPVYSNIFLPPHIWVKLENLFKNSNTKIECVGLTESSEKKVIAFCPKDFSKENLDFPIKFFKISAPNKFRELQHKDFLGTIMSLGLKREVLGDIIVKENTGFCVAFDDIYEVVRQELNQISSLPVKVELISNEEIPKLEFKEIIETVASIRLDSLVSAISGISRNSCLELIEKGEVLVNYSPEKNKSKTIEENSVITIRKKGKFIFEKILGENKKGKYKILIKKYI